VFDVLTDLAFSGLILPGLILSGLILPELSDQLLDLGFFVNHVLANNWIKLFDLKFLGLGTLVFGRSIEVAGTGAGLQLDFVTHDEFLKN
jgi:hypothetical protein